MPLVESQKLGYIGEALKRMRGMVNESEVTRNGVIVDWDNFENLLEYLIKEELHMYASEECFFCTEAILNPKSERERMTSLLFERFGILGLDFGYQPIMSLFASGRNSAIIIEMGEDLTQIVPIWDCFVIENAILRSNIVNGRMVTDHLRQLLNQKGFSFHTSSELEIVREMKEKVVCFNGEPNINSQKIDYFLPDLTKIEMSGEQNLSAECLFNPFILNKNVDGLHEMVHNSFTKCPIDSRLDLYGNIVLCGGNSLIDGLDKRLEQELDLLLPKNVRKKFISMDSPQFSSFIGASIYSSRSTITTGWITKESYQEYGPNICRRDRLSLV
ncbi:hypothetical protein NAEGRDRAFT_60869 [Naegleria gruberi]|uniref:Actin n=1 Tax=Naegleria gruberi TaxID=5762 RepID=D2VTZ5_NAEGR|nr:uncharacterized protein NAEGRDRAFT_60869 [Naegleria gruberi]EFC39806.1 hypothetical protein NAEGRDRAFT_60869 [Naegleria gruberi]|eukprot:XP_002672550.1 hypothetical protein NAEGRDRAFT_60869 [Naegleria gruberi strain NEG-M]